MRPIGFSTGALSHGDFAAALALLADQPVSAVELSALRSQELAPLLLALDTLDLARFAYVSIHAPSSYLPKDERALAAGLLALLPRGLSIIVHPDAIHDFALWEPFGDSLLVENMDLRKPTGRTVTELEEIFAKLPRASFCFDIGHARQVDESMTGARALLGRFSARLRQLHVSEVDPQSRHHTLSPAAIAAFRQVAELIPASTPLIVESPVHVRELRAELSRASLAIDH